MLRAKRQTPRRPRAVEPSADSPLRAYQAAFVEWTQAKGLAAHTAGIRRVALEGFIRWADERGIRTPQEITAPILERYQRYLFHYRRADGRALAFSTQVARINPLKAFFKWAVRERHLLYNPAAELELPKLPPRLPKVILKIEEVEAILAVPDTTTAAGIRDRAILETLYSTAIRRMELANLKLHDLDTRYGSLRVREGKGGKDRVVPVGARACGWLDKYLLEVRSTLLASRDEGILFLTDYGEPFAKNRLGDMVKRMMRGAGLALPGACHLFRHACATHMLENGADIRFIQALLGHSELSTTQIYTQVSIAKLKAIHAATHPAKLTRERELDNDTPGAVAADAPKAARR